MSVIGSFLLAALYILFVPTASASALDYSSCLECHDGIEMMDRNHAFPCRKCHLRPEDRGTNLDTHERVLRHPAAPEHMEFYCGECHQAEISNLRNSLHYTLAGIIGQTRYLWGAQANPLPRHSPSLHPALKPLPPSRDNPGTTAELVDDLLKRRCFMCHIGKVPPQQKGFYRGLGCSACHVFYADDGIYRGGDFTIFGMKGYPLRHTFAKPIPVKQCLHCHNGPRVGADFAGLFEHDHHHSYRTPWRNGSVPEPVYLLDHHQLRADIHYRKGLICVDCHYQRDVMGDGSISTYKQEAVTIRCEHCHRPTKTGNPQRQSPDQGSNRKLFRDRQGRWHPLPAWTRSVPAHNIAEMRRLHCTSCHALWGFYDYGLSLMRDDREDLSRWASWRLQGDERIASLFDGRGRFLGATGNQGPWFLGWRFRRWEFLTLGVDSRDRIAPFRPQYQYTVSFVDRKGRVVLDSVVPKRQDTGEPGWAYMPFYPHTVSPRSRSCEDCHGRALVAGKGLMEGRSQDLLLTIPTPPIYPTLRLLRGEEVKRLVEKTPLFREKRARVFWLDTNGVGSGRNQTSN